MPDIPSHIFNVSGFIYNEFNDPLVSCRVNLIDHDFRSTQKLGSTSTDSRGFYSIEFKLELAINPEYKTPDVSLEIATINSNSFIDRSPIYFNIKQQTTIDYKLGGVEYAGENEFSYMKRLIEIIIQPKGISLADLVENGKFNDLSFIAGYTGFAYNKVSFISAAHKFFKSSKLPPEYFFALFNYGVEVPDTIKGFKNLKEEVFYRAVCQGIQTNLISWEYFKKAINVYKKLLEIAKSSN